MTPSSLASLDRTGADPSEHARLRASFAPASADKVEVGGPGETDVGDAEDVYAWTCEVVGR